MATKKSAGLDEQTAREFTESASNIQLGGYQQIMVGMKLGVPEALSLTPDEWVAEIGGPVRLDMYKRREAVAEMTEEGLSRKEIGAALDISENTVSDERSADVAQRDDSSSGGHETVALRDMTAEDRRAEVARLDDGGLSAGQIAAQLDISVQTVRRDLRAMRGDGPSDALKKAREEKAANELSEAEQKANRAEFDESLTETKKAFAGMLSPDAYIVSAIEVMDQLEELGGEMKNFEYCVEQYAELGRRLWEHGAMRGFDVSRISEAIRRFEDGES